MSGFSPADRVRDGLIHGGLAARQDALDALLVLELQLAEARDDLETAIDQRDETARLLAEAREALRRIETQPKGHNCYGYCRRMYALAREALRV